MNAAQVAILNLLVASAALNAGRVWTVKLDHGKQRGLRLPPEVEESFNAALDAAANALRTIDDSAPLRRELGALLQACRAFRSSFFVSQGVDPADPEGGHKRIAKAPQDDWRRACEAAAKFLPAQKWRAPWPQGYSLY